MAANSCATCIIVVNSFLILFQLFFYGAAAGFITRFTCQPFDVLKIRFQLQASERDNAKYKGLIQAVRTIVKEERVLALWKGHVPAQILSVIYGAAQFSSYKKINLVVHSYGPYRHGYVDNMLHFASGALSGMFGTLVSFPFDVMRTRLIAQGEPKMYNGIIECSKKMYKMEGPLTFYRGLMPAFVQVAPMSGLSFGFNNMIKKLWLLSSRQISSYSQPIEGVTVSPFSSLIIGMLAGVSAKVILYPFDLVKKRLQVQGFDQGHMIVPNVLQCSGVVDCFIVTVRNEGFLGLFKGMKASLIKAGVTTAIYFTGFDYICQMLAAV